MIWGWASLWLVTGVLLWSFIEYGVHRWLFHGLGVAHHVEAHHGRPWRKYVIPARLVLPLTALVYAPWAPLLDWRLLAAGATGVLLGWRWYEYLHARFHDGKYRDEPSEPWNAGYFEKLYMRHQSHHRFDHPGNFGVTTSLWDRLFKTEEQVTYTAPEPVVQEQVAEPSLLADLAAVTDQAGFKRTELGAINFRSILERKGE